MKLARQKLRGDRCRLFGAPTFSCAAACSPDAAFTPGREAGQLLGQGMGWGRFFLEGPPFLLRPHSHQQEPLRFGLQSSSLAKRLLYQLTFEQGLQRPGLLPQELCLPPLKPFIA
ncbi:unnamed protein product [Durusdinium trenchii]|uniref:Uncharacterized protein n=2 Tax=Durusdinium trenchii TaxID=1381693 RepID=A0ABP0RLF9_9DINO